MSNMLVEMQDIALENRIKRDTARIELCFVVRQVISLINGGRHSGAEIKHLIKAELPRIEANLLLAKV